VRYRAALHAVTFPIRESDDKNTKSAVIHFVKDGSSQQIFCLTSGYRRAHRRER